MPRLNLPRSPHACFWCSVQTGLGFFGLTHPCVRLCLLILQNALQSSLLGSRRASWMPHQTPLACSLAILSKAEGCEPFRRGSPISHGTICGLRTHCTFASGAPVHASLELRQKISRRTCPAPVLKPYFFGSTSYHVHASSATAPPTRIASSLVDATP